MSFALNVGPFFVRLAIWYYSAVMLDRELFVAVCGKGPKRFGFASRWSDRRDLVWHFHHGEKSHGYALSAPITRLP